MIKQQPFYLPEGLPTPIPEPHGLSAPYWQALKENRLLVQHCPSCGAWQFGPEWICHACHSFEPTWEEVAPSGTIYSWERVWHPVHPNLKDQVPYLVVLVELPHAGNVRMLGNLLGAPMQAVTIGDPVIGHFEHHNEASVPFSLLQWSVVRP